MIYVISSPERSHILSIATDDEDWAIGRYVYQVWGADGKRHTVRVQDGVCHDGELWKTLDVIVSPLGIMSTAEAMR